LSRGSILYLEEISRALHDISLGNFSVRIRTRSKDELGQLGENIMQMAARLKLWMAEEREAERSKNELITSVSHDLRTPLTSILGYLELIEKDSSRDIAALRRNAGIAYQKSQQLKKLIDDLFEYTTVSQGALHLKLARIDLKALFGQLAEEFVPVLQAADMEYRLLLPEEECFVIADGDLLVRVFQNLISNAIRYGRAGKFVDLAIYRAEEWLVASIMNYGNPISANELLHIFERFYRVGNSDSDQTSSAGLGLAIAKNIMNLHHGTIAAHSSTEKTVFEVKLKSIS
jgi:signal transduction histidine kinase